MEEEEVGVSFDGGEGMVGVQWPIIETPGWRATNGETRFPDRH